jgi:predicted nucleic acid-binding protein
MTLVVDASVALTWFLSEEPHASRALTIAQDEPALIAPDFLIAEVCDAAWRSVKLGRLSQPQADAIAANLPHFFEALVSTTRLAPRAVAIAAQLDHPVYDCLYLALAEMERTRLVTADAHLVGKVRATPWAQWTINLSKYNLGTNGVT